MSDVFDSNKRSEIMSHVRQRDTEPELRVRRLLHAAGYRYLVHVGSLPGRPDIVFTRRRKVVFVHGCFWHGHEGCSRATRPRGNAEFWAKKTSTNRARDKRVVIELARLGWQVLVLWQCELRDTERVRAQLEGFLGPPRVR